MRTRVLFTLLLLSFVSFGFKCGDNGGGNSTNSGGDPNGKVILYSINRPNPTGDDCLYHAESFHQTPGGVTVRSCVDVPPEALAAIERGIVHQIRNSSHYDPDWTAARSLTEYQVFLVPEMARTQIDDPGAPALFVRYLSMNATVSDPIMTAGTCIGVDGAMFVEHGQGIVPDPRYPSEVIAEQSQENWSHLTYLEEASRNESEHRAEWDNNKGMFRSFAIAGDVHPHFPDWDGAPPMLKKLKLAHPPVLTFSPCSAVNGVMVCKPAGINLPKQIPVATATPVRKHK